MEHVHVHAGGQAIVGNIEAGGGATEKSRDNPMHKSPMLLRPRCGAKTRAGTPCQSPAMKNGRFRMHGGTNPGPPKGNQNALKHGLYAAYALARRREISSMLKDMKALIDEAQ